MGLQKLTSNLGKNMEKTVSIKLYFPKRKQPYRFVQKLHEPLIKKEVEETNPRPYFYTFSTDFELMTQLAVTLFPI